jgi:hypothetical protein
MKNREYQKAAGIGCALSLLRTRNHASAIRCARYYTTVSLLRWHGADAVHCYLACAERCGRDGIWAWNARNFARHAVAGIWITHAAA